ncbi:MAG TPA: FAD-dependent oxidoreductase, partial [Candidatus Krumholzibacteria bacterium]|nr:FAD-dependent oxidoreductase [Candidatus Krumholzibacteria bacterium]
VRTENGPPTEEAAGELPCELIVVATGQERLASLAALFPQVQCDEKGRVMADPETMATGNPRVFTGGDCYNGGKEVVNAVDDGQRAARAIDRLLRGEN